MEAMCSIIILLVVYVAASILDWLTGKKKDQSKP